MEAKGKLIICGAASGALLVGWFAYKHHTKEVDHKAALFFSELERNISPATVGLAENDAFKITYFQDVMKTIKKPYYLLTMKTATGFAKDIYDSWGFFDDDENKIYGVFRALKDKVAVSQVSNQYYIKNKINLIDDLRARLSGDEVGEVMKIVNKMPDYRLAPTK